MGVLNVTPDSFSDGGRYADLDAAVAHGVRLRDDGRGPGRRRRRVDPAGRRAGRRRDRDRPGAAGDPGAGRRRRAGQHRHHPGRGRRGRAGGRRRRGQRRLRRAGRPGHGPGGPRRRLPVGADALARALPRDARAGQLRRRGRRGPGRAGPSGSTRRWPPGSAADRIILDPGLGFAKTAAHNWALSARLPRAARPRLPGAVRRPAASPTWAGCSPTPDGTPRASRRRGRRRPSPPACWPSRPAPGGYACTTSAATADALAVWRPPAAPGWRRTHRRRAARMSRERAATGERSER